MAFLQSLNISASALSAQRLRADVIAQNIAQASTTRTDTGEPYRRQLTVFRENGTFADQLSNSRSVLTRARERLAARNLASSENQSTSPYGGVLVAEVVEDDSPFVPVYDPTDPDADAEGYVYMPNVNVAKEQIDALAVKQSYDANMTILNAMASMAQSALQIGK